MLRCALSLLLSLLAGMTALPLLAAQPNPPPTATRSELLAKSKPSEWRRPKPDNLVVMQLPEGKVLIELASDFTPLHAANIRTLIREHYYDGLAIVRVQDNFVAQWDDPAGDDDTHQSKVRSLGKAETSLAPEFTQAINPKLVWTPLPDGDVYAPQVGFSEGFPVARDPATGREWLTHCYGAVGVARDVGARTGNGSALYAVIGQAPRRLDRNLAVAGRVLQGMPLLSSLPRGSGPMGFYAQASQRTKILSVKLAADLPFSQRPDIEVLRTTSPTFAALIEAQRHRQDAFYTVPAGRVGLCDIAVPARNDGTAHGGKHG